MAPLARPAFLSVFLLLAPALLRAQTEDETRDRLAALKAQYGAAGAQQPASAAAPPASAPGSVPAAVAPVDPAKLRASQAEIEKAGIPIDTLIDGSDQGMQWTARNVLELGPAIAAASAAVQKLHDENPSAVSERFYGNGTMVNLEDSIKWATGLWGGSDLKRGCVSHQNVTLAAVRKAIKPGDSLEVSGVFVIRKVTGHHAVIVFPKGTDWKRTGVVLDGWIHQESAPDRMTWLFKDWYGATSWKVSLE